MPSELEKRILPIDSQILTAFQRCDWYTFLAYVKNRRRIPMGDENENFDRGTLTHWMAECFYKALKAKIPFKDALANALEKGREKYSELSLDIQYAEYVVDTFSQYATRWRFDGIEVVDVEKEFILKIYEDDELEVHYTGKIDLICKMPNIGLCAIDHKNRKRKSEETLLNNQFIGYSIATGTNIVYVNEIGLQKTLEPEEKFRRIPLSYTVGMQERWLKNTILFAKRLDDAIQNNVWPMRWNPFICKSCAYNSVCSSSSEEEMTRKLMTEFQEVERWDVTSTMEKDE